jgi:hypothetical protein
VACLSFSTHTSADRRQKAAARRGRAAAFFALGAAVATLGLALLAGCGSGTLAYVDSQYRFSLDYDAALAPAGNVTPAVSGSGRPAFTVAFLDPKAAHIGDRYVDGVWVAVLRLPSGSHWPPAPAMAAELRSRLAAAVSGRLHGSVTTAQALTINGRAAWFVGYSYRLDGAPVRALTYVIVKGDYEYQLTIQTATSRWTKMWQRLAASVDSFTIR